MEIVLKRLESQTCDVVCRYRLHDQLSLDKGMLIDDLDSGCQAGALKVLSEVDEEMEREDSSIQEKLDMENKGLQQKEGGSCPASARGAAIDAAASTAAICGDSFAVHLLDQAPDVTHLTYSLYKAFRAVTTAERLHIANLYGQAPLVWSPRLSPYMLQILYGQVWFWFERKEVLLIKVMVSSKKGTGKCIS
ncbi:uncharacterized protein [Aegilops tauschii subsp. strangulata]|uniref:uncharacterized protein isoform X1 n=1 Tax=Aegilops tauschii subsp. strangulata TaxID=200361 RepID=UPI001ABC8FE7|nr:uncharacterized protein LOC120965246 isoform X1 [Aegilops tauschii subsp. strangulata]